MARQLASPIPLQRWCGHCEKTCFKRTLRGKCPHCHHYELCDYLPTLEQIAKACLIIQEKRDADFWSLSSRCQANGYLSG